MKSPQKDSRVEVPHQARAFALPGGGRWTSVTAAACVSAMVRNNVVIALSAGFAIGILTSVGQTVLPDEVRSVANSAAPWSLAAFGLAFLDRRPAQAVVLCGGAMLAMLVGYNVSSSLRGFAVGTYLWVFWGAMSVVVAPVLGLASGWVRGTGVRAAAAVGIVAAVPVGEGVWGFLTVADTTFGPYWLAEAALGVVGFGVLVVMKLRTSVSICIAMSVLISGSAVYFVLASSLP